MNRTVALFRSAVLGIVICSFFYGCTGQKIIRAEYRPDPAPQPAERGGQEFSVEMGEEVIGRHAFMRIEKGDTLPDIARHFGLGVDAVSAANPGVDRWVPAAGARIMLPMSFILPDAPREGIVINLAAMRLFHYRGEGALQEVSTFPVGIGTEERPSPIGQMHVARKAVRPVWHVPASIAVDHRRKGDPLPARVLPGPDNPLGEYALYLSRSGYLIHGTNKPASIGLRATNGCIRLYPEDVGKLYEQTTLKTPVSIVDQPYLLGRADGVLYLAVHRPPDDVDEAEFDRMYRRLKKLERESGRRLDWGMVRDALAEARGIPVPISGPVEGRRGGSAEPAEIRRPAALFGRPVVPELRDDAWSVLAADTEDGTEAERLAAILNHQGPQIPARVVQEERRYRVVAGPFAGISEAKQAVKRLKIDLETDGAVIEPVRKLTRKEVSTR